MDAIRRGEKTQTLRNWKSQRLQPGQKDLIPGIGPIRIDSVEKVSLDELTDADAIPDGFPTIDALKAEIRDIYGDEPAGNFYRVRFHVLKSDEIEEENDGAGSLKKRRKKTASSPVAGMKSKTGSIPPEMLIPRSSEYPAILQFVKEIKQEFAEVMERYLYKIESQESQQMDDETQPLTEAQVVEKMVYRCRINRSVCDWNHEPGKSQDFFDLFLRSPRDERGVPTLDGYRLRSLMRDFCGDDQDLWDSINWIACEICSAWTEWQYAVEHWDR